MPICFFVSDLHGRLDRYEKLFGLIAAERPEAVFLGGDLLPIAGLDSIEAEDFTDFTSDYLATEFGRLRDASGENHPRIIIILGNDDGRVAEASIRAAEAEGIWEYAHNQRMDFGKYPVYGYSYIPPSPFMLKDWERYDISRFVDPGCISPEEGRRTVPVSARKEKYATIAEDLKGLAGDDNLSRAIFLFHSPPYRTKLDRAALDNRMIEHVPMDVNIGSIAIRRFIETRQPLLTLHGHVHESARLTGSWKDRIGRTICISAAYDGPELALVRFDPDCPEEAVRELL